MEPDTLQYRTAKWLLRKGYSVIPVKPNKKPYIPKWTPYQSTKPTKEEILSWWQKWPEANVAVITGKVSDMIGIDVDTKDAFGRFEDYMPDGFETPMCRTPRGGWHYWFKYEEGFRTCSNVLEGVDIRADGGYLIVPPSENGNGEKYAWLDGLKPSDVDKQPIPEDNRQILIQALSSTSIYNAKDVPREGPDATHSNTKQHDATLSWGEGLRDDSLFHVANSLVKGDMAPANIRKVLKVLAKNCEPPFSESETEIKIKSAFSRIEDRDRNLHNEIKNWVMEQDATLTYQDCDRELHITTSRNMRNRTVVFGRLVEEGLIERVGNRRGSYKRVDPGVEWLDIENAKTEPLSIKLPFGIERILNIPEKSVICIAGEPGAGKTAFMLNCAVMNMDHPWSKTYLTSEAGAQALRIRLEENDMGLSVRDIVSQVRFGAKTADFHSAIDPNGINFIDYIEVHDSFYLIDQYLTSLFDKLDRGVVIAGLQKSQNSKLGLGGGFSMQKPEMYLILEDNYPEGAVMTIRKGRWWVKGTSQVGLKMRYRTYRGINLKATQKDWGA